MRKVKIGTVGDMKIIFANIDSARDLLGSKPNRALNLELKN